MHSSKSKQEEVEMKRIFGLCWLLMAVLAAQEKHDLDSGDLKNPVMESLEAHADEYGPCALIVVSRQFPLAKPGWKLGWVAVSRNIVVTPWEDKWDPKNSPDFTILGAPDEDGKREKKAVIKKIDLELKLLALSVANQPCDPVRVAKFSSGNVATVGPVTMEHPAGLVLWGTISLSNAGDANFIEYVVKAQSSVFESAGVFSADPISLVSLVTTVHPIDSFRKDVFIVRPHAFKAFMEAAALSK